MNNHLTKLLLAIVLTIIFFSVFYSGETKTDFLPIYENVKLVNRSYKFNSGLPEIVLNEKQLLTFNEYLKNYSLHSRLNNASKWNIAINYINNKNEERLIVSMMLTHYDELVFELNGKYFIDDLLSEEIISILKIEKLLLRNENEVENE